MTQTPQDPAGDDEVDQDSEPTTMSPDDVNPTTPALNEEPDDAPEASPS
jgi:hypothetical protein